MVIGVIFKFGNEFIQVKVIGESCLFFKTKNGIPTQTSIDGLKLDYKGVCREFPDLETRDNWREIAIQRFKDKMKEFKTEDERINFIVEDLKKFGYIPVYKQKEGFRMEKYK